MSCLTLVINVILHLFDDFIANTEANEKRIRNVESCFGASGQVSHEHGNV